MSNIQIDMENVDIYQHPTEIIEHYGAVTCGDLHANPIRFLYFLIATGVLHFEQDPQEFYQAFVAAYEENERLLAKCISFDESGQLEEIYIEPEVKALLEKNFLETNYTLPPHSVTF